MEYGTTREYKNKVDISAQIPKGTYNYVLAQLTGLDSATVYFYRVRANMGEEIIYSAENVLKLKKDFIMIPIEFKQLSDSSILLQGLLNANGNLLTNVKFQYGLTENYGDSIAGTPNYAYNYGTSLVSSILYHLSPSVNYYGRIMVLNGTTRYYSDPFRFKLSITGVDSSVDNSSLVIYPNPATNNLTINSVDKVDKVEIYDSFGKLSMISNQTKVNISKLEKGIYLIRVYTGSKITTKKIMKN